jgi:two-component system, cell cycle sensor histidine kinase and response regulator CckA
MGQRESESFSSGGMGTAAGKAITNFLERSDRLAPALLESASQAIVGVSASGKIVLANARAEEMFGYTRFELRESTIETLLPEANRKKHVHDRASYFANPHVRPMGIGVELSGRRKDGSVFPVEVSLSHVDTPGGKFAIAFVSDISQRKRLEEQLMHAQKMEAVGRLAGGVAHDFNNMLTVISGYNQMILDQISPLDPLRGYAEEVLKASERAAALTNQLLAFSRRQIVQPRVFDVNEVLTHTEKMLRRLIGEDIELNLTLHAEAGNIKADPGHLEQAIVNLATNARDAMPRGGRLTVETCNVALDETYAKTHLGVQPGEYVMIAVSDSGVGMDLETKRHIFEPFFTTKERGKGTGLGLATVYGIVKQAGGDIWVYSEKDKGTTFKLYFPRVANPASDVVGSGAGAPAMEGAETILVVEDEQGVRDLTAKMLKRLGYTVLVAANGHEALQISKAFTGPIALLLSDVVMPNMSGSDLADELRRTRPHIKVLYVSGYTENTVAHHGVQDPATGFLAKPFSRDALASKLRESLGKAKRKRK